MTPGKVLITTEQKRKFSSYKEHEMKKRGRVIGAKIINKVFVFFLFFFNMLHCYLIQQLESPKLYLLQFINSILYPYLSSPLIFYLCRGQSSPLQWHRPCHYVFNLLFMKFSDKKKKNEIFTYFPYMVLCNLENKKQCFQGKKKETYN